MCFFFGVHFIAVFGLLISFANSIVCTGLFHILLLLDGKRLSNLVEFIFFHKSTDQ